MPHITVYAIIGIVNYLVLNLIFIFTKQFIENPEIKSPLFFINMLYIGVVLLIIFYVFFNLRKKAHGTHLISLDGTMKNIL